MILVGLTISGFFFVLLGLGVLLCGSSGWFLNCMAAWCGFCGGWFGCLMALFLCFCGFGGVCLVLRMVMVWIVRLWCLIFLADLRFLWGWYNIDFVTPGWCGCFGVFWLMVRVCRWFVLSG